jgi:hypothetical protein
MSIFDSVLIYDVETTISNKGDPFDTTNKLVMSGFKWLNDDTCVCVKGDCSVITQSNFGLATLIVGFNLKFDLHWARRIGVDISNIAVWDCQIAEFLFNKQANRYPSLNQACEKYGIPYKLDVVKTEYWNKGIDTDEVPVDILRDYLEGDLDRTERVFKEQVKQFKGIEL